MERPNAIFTTSTLLSAASKSWVTAKNRYVNRMIFRYCTPSSMMCLSVVKTPTAWKGNRLTSTNKRSATTSPACIAVAAIFFMGSVCFFPQYWLQKITSPSPSAIRIC